LAALIPIASANFFPLKKLIFFVIVTTLRWGYVLEKDFNKKLLSSSEQSFTTTTSKFG